MTDFTTDRSEAMSDFVTGEIIDQKDLAERLLVQANEQGGSLVGPGGLLNQLTKSMLETAEWGWPLPGDCEALGERMSRVRTLPRIRRRDPPSHLHDERNIESINARYR